MKKFIFLLGGLLSSWVISAQIMSQSDVALLFSLEENNGTARYTAMSGAFGALGGDMSAGDVNPAGLAVFKDSRVSATFGLRKNDLLASYTGNSGGFEDDFFNLHQAGGVLVFDGNNNSNWSKFALGVNYTLARDFNNFYNVEGNSGNSDIEILEFSERVVNLLDDPFLNFDGDNSNDILYNTSDYQFFENATSGQNEKFTFTLAAKYNENLYLGLSIIAHNVNSFQRTLFEHGGSDDNGNTLDASYLQELRTFGEGIGASFGAIFKPSHETRFGITYQTPIWYNLTDEFFDDLEISLSNTNDLFFLVNDLGIADYEFTTPSRFTGSFAYLFGKEGLVSVDYTYKDYQNIKLRPQGDFSEVNRDISQNLKGSSQFKVGAEWRFDKISLRGGYFYEESPFEDALDSDNIEGYSAGLGIKLGKNTRLDLAYQNRKNTGVYNFANAVDFPGAELDTTNDTFTASLVIGL